MVCWTLHYVVLCYTILTVENRLNMKRMLCFDTGTAKIRSVEFCIQRFTQREPSFNMTEMNDLKWCEQLKGFEHSM